MKKISALLALILASSAFAVEPYNSLAKNNYTVQVRSVASGSNTKNDYKTSWGSYDKTTVQHKIMEVTTSAPATATVRFTFVFKDEDGEFYLPCDAEEYQGQPVEFLEVSERRDLKLAALGERYKAGDRIYGWFVSVVKDGRVVAVAGSAERFKKIAETGIWPWEKQ